MIRGFPSFVKSSKWIEASTDAPGLVCTLVHRFVAEAPAIPSTYFSPLWIPGLNYCSFPLLSSGVALSAFQKIRFFFIFLWIEHLTVDIFIFSSIFMWFYYTFAAFLIYWRYFVFLQSWRKSRKWNSVSRHMGIRAKTCYRCRVFEKYSGFLCWLLRQLGTRNSLFGVHLAQPPSLWALMFKFWSSGSECIAESHSLWETARSGHQRPLAEKVVNEGDNKVFHTRWTSDGALAGPSPGIRHPGHAQTRVSRPPDSINIPAPPVCPFIGARRASDIRTVSWSWQLRTPQFLYTEKCCRCVWWWRRVRSPQRSEDESCM